MVLLDLGERLSSLNKKPTLNDIENLPKLEKIIMEYFLKHISVGEIIAVIELREIIKHTKDPELNIEEDDVVIEMNISKALARLVEKGFLEHAEGCYNLAQHLREELKESKKYPTWRKTLF